MNNNQQTPKTPNKQGQDIQSPDLDKPGENKQLAGQYNQQRPDWQHSEQSPDKQQKVNKGTNRAVKRDDQDESAEPVEAMGDDADRRERRQWQIEDELKEQGELQPPALDTTQRSLQQPAQKGQQPQQPAQKGQQPQQPAQGGQPGPQKPQGDYQRTQNRPQQQPEERNQQRKQEQWQREPTSQPHPSQR